jgi:two-component system response regulator LytT
MTESSASMRTLVLEDEWVARNYLVELLQGTGLATVVGAVGAFGDAAAFLRDAAGTGAIDVVFVDVNLVGSTATGMDLIRQFAGAPGAPVFVLATAMKEHAVEAFSLGVVDYILKPFDADRIAQCLARIQAARRVPAPGAPSRRSRIVARNKRNLVFLNLDEVWAIEAAQGMSLVHSERGTFDVDLSLDAIAGTFGHIFPRVHRNWLVNEDHILELERDAGETALLLGARTGSVAKLRVPVARDRAASVRSRLVDEGVGIRKR